MTGGKSQWKRSLLRIGGPAFVMALTAAHPGYTTDASHELQRISASGVWLPLHLVLLPGFALYSLSLLAWPTSGGRWWRVRQGGVVLNLVFYSAFVGVDGVAGWLLAHAGAQAPAGLRAGLVDGLTLLFSAWPVGVLALLGVLGWLIAAVAVRGRDDRRDPAARPRRAAGALGADAEFLACSSGGAGRRRICCRRSHSP